MQKARDQALALRPIALSLLVSVRFQVLFTPLPGFFSPFPHGTGSLSVAKEYLALESGLSGFPQGFSCPVVLRYLPREPLVISFTGLSPSMADRSRSFNYNRGL